MASRVLNKGPMSGPHVAGIYSDMTVDGEEIGTLVVVVDRAKNLPNRKTMGKQDPYCAARLGKEAKKTETDIRGGQTPKWDQELRFTVHDSPDYYSLKVSVFNDDKRTDLIGETWVSLGEVVVSGGGKGDKWHNLNCKGKYAGEIRIELTYYDTRVSSERQASEGMQGHMGMGLGPGGSPSMAGPRQQPPLRRRPLPAGPNDSSPMSTPDRSAATPQHSFGPRNYHTPPHQRPLPASNSPSGFAIRETPMSSPASFQPDNYQPSEPPTEYAAHHEDRSDYGYESNMHEDYHTQREVSPYSLNYADDAASVHASEQGWSDSPAWNHQQQPHGYSEYHGHRGPPLPHSYSAPAVAPASEGYHEVRHSSAEPFAGGDFGHEQPPDWSRDQRRSQQMHNMQPTVEDEYPSPPPPPAHRNSAPTLSNYRSTPNLNSSQDMRAYAAHRHRMSVAENGPQSSPLAHSPHGNQVSSLRGSPQTHPSQGSVHSTPTHISREMVSQDSPQPSPFTYQRPQYAPVESTPPAPSPTQRHSSPHSVPLIKPRPISPSSQPSPVPAPLRQTRPPVSSHSTPTRKSVSPHPAPPGSGGLGGGSTPFSPDSFDAFNPAVKSGGRSPIYYPESHAPTQQTHSPSPVSTINSRKGFTPIESHRSGEPIITSSGSVVDPSDHLPADSWAPEPERKGPKAASEIGAEERAGRVGPRGAQPMITVRTKVGGAAGAGTSIPVTMKGVGMGAPKPYGQPSYAPSSGGREEMQPVSHPNPAPMMQMQRDSGALVTTAAGGGGRNRLVKKSRPLGAGAPDLANRGAPPDPNPALNYDPSYSYQPQHAYRENFDAVQSHGQGGYRGAGGPPPVPAKVPLGPYPDTVELGMGAPMGDAEMQALSEEMRSIDIGPANGTRSGGRVRRGRFGA
ncbi:hypothetical protein EV356DRAFT_574984 [Viridothelium virens]|uniref:C2 domain-containing protein n=1 Tax=Viridothelium virens TaxID=1048519 RepID=A0A6A6HFY5_VIRVR|nr:hypothetical protein EV356DRAFT_574984 [Viridothelium virens]